MPSDDRASDAAARGSVAAFSAYFLWGIVPLYWKQLDGIGATELIAHRIIWSLVFLLAIQWWRGRLRTGWIEARQPRARWTHLVSGALLSLNWLIYVWGVHHDQVLECSLGYFLVPLLNVALGRLVLGETLRRWQRVALGLATAGVLVLVIQLGRLPWIALGLAGSFGFYGLLRKQASLGPMNGLALETALMAPLALLWLGYLGAGGQLALGHRDAITTTLILSTGVVTTIPLLLFAYGARRLRLVTLGLLQYVAPTCQFLLGWLVYHESLPPARAMAFALIWLGLACYALDAWRAHRTRSG